VIRRLFIQLSVVLLAAFGVAIHQPSQAQSITPTPEQLDMFRNMSPDQQQAILQQVGGALGGGSGGSRQSSRSRDSQDSSGRDQQDQNQSASSNNSLPLIPTLKGDDSVIVEIDFHLPPKTLPTQLVYPNSAFGVPGVAQGAPNGAPVQLQGAQAQQQLQQQVAAPPAPLSEEEQKAGQRLINLIRAKNPYTLSRDGILYLPGFAGIPLGGLIEDLATLRLKVEPALRNLDVRITLLPLTKSGTAGLKPFGYDLFQRSPSTFAPVTNIPVPADYVMGPGDELAVQLYGNQNRNLQLSVGRDGRVNFPELGPVSVGGQLFSQVKSAIEERVQRQMIGVRASVSMGDTRSIRVFVLGEANRPGSYTISGLGTISSALYAAGGVKPVGSLRNIELKRQGVLVRTLDLYNLLVRGDTADDTKLLPGDVIFIPPVGPQVSVDGEVRRPAVYEAKGTTTVADAISLAGGLNPEADMSKVMLTRIDQNQRRIVLQINPSEAADGKQPVRSGDLLEIPRLRPTLDSAVSVNGHVFSSGTFAYRSGMRLSDVIHSVDDLQPNADLHYLLIRRELPPDRRVAVLSADLSAALKSPGSAADVPLMARDRITVFDLESGRDRVIQPVLDDLRLQSTLATPTEVVRISGRVKVPGEYPLEPGMRVSDLIRAGGSLQDAAYEGSAELTRYAVQKGESRQTQLINIDLAAVLRGDPAANLTLQPFDLLSIKEVPLWGSQESVTLGGEVRFPGQYAIKRGETLKAVVARAGGLTAYAFPEGSVFTRVELKRREQEQLDGLAERLKHDLAVLALQSIAASQGNGGGSALTVGQSLLSQLSSTKAVGRLVINLPKALQAKGGSDADIILRGGDQLLIPRVQQEVTVIGEVPNPTSHLYKAGLTRDDYIQLSGGATRRADKTRIYVVHADGSVVSSEGNRWFSRRDVDIRTGDTVVVPLDTERLPPLPFWQAVTQIIYNVAIAAAAVHSF
jgi:protein involved in polysaccharide export with SLBB domain